MNRKNLLFVFPLSIVALSLTLVLLSWKTGNDFRASTTDPIQEEANQALALGLDGIIVYIDQKEKPPSIYSAGVRNRKSKKPMDPKALFKIASISKLYIAAATVKLVNRGDLHLNDTLANLLPELATRVQYADQITLRMLIQHRSGIPNWIDDPAFPWSNPPTDVNKILELVLGDSADFKPNSRYQYSNTNYVLLGRIMDRKLGYSHHQYIKKELLDPLGLKDTYLLFSDVDSNKVISGYDFNFEGDVRRLDFVAPGGSMVATAKDVAVFVRALNDGTLLNEQERKIYSSVYIYGHTGLLPGYESIARYYRDIDAVVVQFVNTSGGDAWTNSEKIYNNIVKTLRKQKRDKG